MRNQSSLALLSFNAVKIEHAAYQSAKMFGRLFERERYAHHSGQLSITSFILARIHLQMMAAYQRIEARWYLSAFKSENLH